MIELTIFTETFVHIMQRIPGRDLPFQAPNNEKFCIWLKDPSETSIVIELTDEIIELLEERRDPSFARENLRLIQIDQEEDLANLKVMSKISHQLIEQNIEVDFISTFDFDYLLIENAQLDKFVKIVSRSFKIKKETINQ